MFSRAKEYLSIDDVTFASLFKLLEVKGGYIICTAFVYDFKKCSEYDSKQAMIDCKNTDRWGLYLCDIEKNDFSELKLYRGQQGIWYIKNDNNYER